MLEQRAQVLQVEQQQAAIVGDLERKRQHAFLRVVQPQDARQQQRSQVRDGGADRVALLAEDVPEHRRAAAERGLRNPHQLEPLGKLGRCLARLTQTGQVPFDVGHEDRDADGGQALGHDLEGDGLAGSGGAGDEAVPVAERGEHEAFDVAVLGDQHRLGHGAKSLGGRGVPSSLASASGFARGGPRNPHKARNWHENML